MGVRDEDTGNQFLGSRLRELRLNAGLSLRALARALDISASAVSQIETGARVPSVNRLIAIVTALGVPLAAAFEAPGSIAVRSGETALTDAVPTNYVLTRAGTVPLTTLKGGVTYRRLTPGLMPGLDLFESTYPPGAMASAHGSLVRHDGHEVGSVESGELSIEFETETVLLGPGDSITFPSTRPHRLGNPSATTACVAVWLIVHP
ncbi:XRE family transcriptional regulator [Cryobacterium melibiosiphilum]|uniref:XRE family transcriptional regulator n=1 Tax=Cryobacterium melibiosiphilum TaxID=995039 RepID=A0A3A5MHH3_9MICO|nr:XRE family transcriptional regulator [Cryobacterium melibiosiphilum]RJT85281.1 XRE family transcriptional regulator [Cryobacterium melibiosiphilum]